LPAETWEEAKDVFIKTLRLRRYSYNTEKTYRMGEGFPITSALSEPASAVMTCSTQAFFLSVIEPF
jgi:hypothetical protein